MISFLIFLAFSCQRVLLFMIHVKDTDFGFVDLLYCFFVSGFINFCSYLYCFLPSTYMQSFFYLFELNTLFINFQLSFSIKCVWGCKFPLRNCLSCIPQVFINSTFIVIEFLISNIIFLCNPWIILKCVFKEHFSVCVVLFFFLLFVYWFLTLVHFAETWSVWCKIFAIYWALPCELVFVSFVGILYVLEKNMHHIIIALGFHRYPVY